MKWDLILLPRWTNAYETPSRHFAWLNLCLMATRKVIKNLWLFETIVWGRERSYNIWQMHTIWHYDRWNTWGKHAKRSCANLGIMYSSHFTHFHVYAAANWHQIRNSNFISEFIRVWHRIKRKYIRSFFSLEQSQLFIRKFRGTGYLSYEQK